MVWVVGAGITALPVLLAASVLWGLGFAAMNSMQQSRLVGAAPAFCQRIRLPEHVVLYIEPAVGSGLGGQFFAPMISCTPTRRMAASPSWCLQSPCCFSRCPRSAFAGA